LPERVRPACAELRLFETQVGIAPPGRFGSRQRADNRPLTRAGSNQDSIGRTGEKIMARVPYLNREDLSEADREIFDNLVAERGQPVGNIFRTLAHTPGLLRRFLALGGELRNQTAIDPQLRELALLTVGRITNAEYEFVHHWNLARRVGVTREKLEALADWERSAVYSDQERAVIRYAAEATTAVQVQDATWNALKSFMDTRTIMELVQNVAFYNMVVRVLVPARVELEPGVKKL
jgi:alkylhydroperoxidase family enzyme